MVHKLASVVRDLEANDNFTASKFENIPNGIGKSKIG